MAKTKQQKRLKRLNKKMNNQSILQIKLQEKMQYSIMKNSLEKAFPNVNDRLKYIRELIEAFDRDLEEIKFSPV
jgi:hypothetical protein